MTFRTEWQSKGGAVVGLAAVILAGSAPSGAQQQKVMWVEAVERGGECDAYPKWFMSGSPGEVTSRFRSWILHRFGFRASRMEPTLNHQRAFDWSLVSSVTAMLVPPRFWPSSSEGRLPAPCDHPLSRPNFRRHGLMLLRFFIAANSWSTSRSAFGTLPKNRSAQLRSGLEPLADRRRLTDKVPLVPNSGHLSASPTPCDIN